MGEGVSHCHTLRKLWREEGLRREEQKDGEWVAWRISPEPFWLSPKQCAVLDGLGQTLLTFYQAVNRLYAESVRGSQPPWVAEYLDQGKPEHLVEYGRMGRFKRHLPGVIRPDLLLTETGFIATELDSVPGGIGLTAGLGRAYASLGFNVIGGGDGMVQGFAAMIRATVNRPNPRLAIVVSEESRDYRPEMRWLGAALTRTGLETHVLEPRALGFGEEALRVQVGTAPLPVQVIYRFFELFDLKNIPKADLLLYSSRKEAVVITPPWKAYLEEKLVFAFLHHPVLEPFWTRHLGPERFIRLKALFPRTWIVDPRPLPPHAVIPGLVVGGRPITDFRDLARCTQKERQFVLKPSGFSPQAWGSRGVVVGHDVAEEVWAAAIETALAGFAKTPWILQEFHKGQRVAAHYWEPASEAIQAMGGRVRLSPYYFVSGEKAELGGVLATVCPLDKKLIHGMAEAVLAPCGVQGR